MDYEKLIERLRTDSLYADKATLEIMDLCMEAADALTALLEENEKLRAELEQVKHQRDSYRMYHYELASKPNCNTCADKDCKYRPIPGDTVRANCPLWRGSEEG